MKDPGIIAIVAAVALAGAAAGYSAHGNEAQRKSFDAGYAAGKAACEGPSRLERAAKWATEGRGR